MGVETEIIILFKSGIARSKGQRRADQEVNETLANLGFTIRSLSKYVSTSIAYAQKKNVDWDEMLKVFAGLPWERPDTITILAKSEHDDAFAIVEHGEFEGYVAPGCGAWPLPTEEMLEAHRRRKR